MVLMKAINFTKAHSLSMIIQDQRTTLQNNIYLRSEQNLEMHFCNKTIQNFQTNWYNGSEYLYEFLTVLKSLNCPQFKQECKQKTYAFTEFTSLMYLQFCNQTELQSMCFNNLQRTVQNHSKKNLSSTTWDKLIVELDNVSSFNAKEIEDPCVQVSMFDPKNIYQFVEVLNVFAPFCSIVWCGIDERIFKTENVSLWTCMPQRYYQ